MKGTKGHKDTLLEEEEKGEQELQLDVRKNGISQQPMNENGIRFLRQKRFWNQRLCEERKQHYVMFFPHS